MDIDKQIEELQTIIKDKEHQISELAKDKASLMEENQSLKFRLDMLEKALVQG